jgi:hypothetical protein
MACAGCSQDETLVVNRLLDTLSKPQRRELIHYFEYISEEDADSLDSVVSYIDGRMPSTNQIELETSLHHTHIPKLEERGWVDYNDQEGEICYLGNEDAEEILAELLSVFAT